MTLGEWVTAARARLKQSGCPDPAVDAQYLLEDGLDLTRAQARLQRSRALSEEEGRALEGLLARREAGEPLQYVTNRADFMGFRFYVDARVLIPRSDTENLAEAAARFLNRRRAEGLQNPEALDLCAGSGAIGLSLGRLCPFCRITLADVSPDALDVARQNAKALGVAAECLLGDLFATVPGRRFDLIACNPPYIPTGELAGLQREVRREPALALDGGADGLDFYRRVAREAGDHLTPGGALFLEVGAGQAADVRRMLETALRPAESGVILDLNGIERVVWARTR